jgi:predicted transcriptional regulator YheO
VETRRLYMVRDGIVRETLYDDSEGRLVVSAQQYLDEIIEGIARDRENMRKTEFKKVATLPAIVVENLTKRGIYDDRDAFDKWLNSSEATPWRVWRGNV